MSRHSTMAMPTVVLLWPRLGSASQPQPVTLSEAGFWLQGEAHRIVRASMRTMSDGTAAFPPQVGLGYEAFRLRDYAYTPDLVAPALADRTVLDMAKDFQADGACEWIFNGKRQLPNYLAGASLPLAGIRARIERRYATSRAEAATER